MASKLEKAKILVLGKVGDTSAKKTIDVMFNPSDYTIESSNKYSWVQVPGLQSPVSQFVSGDVQVLKVNLFFDTYTNKEKKKPNVRDHTQKIYTLMDVDKDLHTPPVCAFAWNKLKFIGVVDSVSQNFTMFMDDGTPVRAQLSVSFKGVQSIEDQLKYVPRQSPDRTKRRMLMQDEQLWQISSNEYEDPAFWRDIARENNIVNPRKLNWGKNVKVPAIE